MDLYLATVNQSGKITTILVLLFFTAGLLWLLQGDPPQDTHSARLNQSASSRTEQLHPPTSKSKRGLKDAISSSEQDEDPLFAAPGRTPAALEVIPAPPAEESPEASEPSVIYLTPYASPTSAPPSPVSTPGPAVSDPHLDALREVQRLTDSSPASSRIGGARSSKPAAENSLLPPDPSPTATPEITQSPPARVFGQPRGFTLLALMHPRARASMERSIQTLLDSELANLYLGVLTDGSFTKDVAYLSEVVRRLNSNGRTLTLALYLTNGASMRRYDQAVFTSGFNLIEPEAFRFLITSYDEIRSEFRKMAREVRPVFELNRSLNSQNHNIAIVMLEDNLDRLSYVAMRELAAPELADIADFIRNPCAGCYSGNDSDPAGDGLESHSAGDLIALGPRDGYSMDGTSYSFPGEPPALDRLGFEQVKALMGEASSRGLRYFGLWRAGKQGLGSVLTPPEQRTYEVASDEQVQLEIELLRYGLDDQQNAKD